MKAVINTDRLTCIIIGDINEDDWFMVQSLLRDGYSVEAAGTVIAEEDELRKIIKEVKQEDGD